MYPPFLSPLDPRKLKTPGVNPNPELPIRAPIALPPSSPMPRVGPGGEAMRAPVSLPTMGPSTSPMIPAASAPPVAVPDRPAPELSRVGVALPGLPGDTGPKPYSPIEAARYDAGMQRAKRDESGELTGGFKRSKMDIFMNTLQGFAQGSQAGGGFGGLGGALAGAIGTAANPAAGAQYRFNNERLPQMQAEERARVETRRQMQVEQNAALANAKTQSEIDKVNNDFQMRTAEMEAKGRQQKIDNEGKSRQQKLDENYRQGQLNKRSTRLEPMKTPDGKTILVDVNDPNNATKEYAPIERPQSLSDVYKESDADVEGQYNVEQIARDSAANDPDGVSRHMAKQYFDLIKNGGKKADGTPADQQDVADAEQAFILAKDRLYKEKLAGVKSRLEEEKKGARSDAGRNRRGVRPVQGGGAAPASGGASGPTRSVYDLSEKYLKKKK